MSFAILFAVSWSIFVACTSALGYFSSPEHSSADLKHSISSKSVVCPSLSNIPLISDRCPTHIFYAADNAVEIFINGASMGVLSDWNDFASVMTQVRRGDVVALHAKDYGVWYGAIASFYYDRKYHVTGVDDWRAIKATGVTGWMLPSFNACKWPMAVLRSNPNVYTAGMSPFFPYATGARYVWASNAGMSDEIYLRYRIGGEGSCKNSTVRYSADDSATVYVNGAPISSHTNWGTFATASHLLRPGDVVSIVAKDIARVWYGLVAEISLPGLPKIVTGSGEWKAKELTTPGGEAPYLVPSYSSCNWKKAVLRPGSGTYNAGKAMPFPYGSGAQYVWADGVAFGSVMLRHVVGGEVCSCGSEGVRQRKVIDSKEKMVEVQA